VKTWNYNKAGAGRPPKIPENMPANVKVEGKCEFISSGKSIF
jgi:hypothetical protein